MMSKLPKWIEYGAFLLALTAGCINAIGLLGFEHQSVSHVSGTATLFGTGIISTPFTHSLHLIGVLFSFFAGASLAGFLVHNTTLGLGRHYDTALIIEGCLILFAAFLLSENSYYGHFAASAACGLQNALATSYSGAIIRTTHLTGIFTDLGIMIGSMARGNPLDKRKLVLFLLIIAGFIFGGTIGSILYSYYQFKSLFFPAMTCFALAIAYFIYSRNYR